MSGKTFLDTNILVYAVDQDDVARREASRKAIAAASAGCARVYSEDLNAGQTVLGVVIESPLG